MTSSGSEPAAEALQGLLKPRADLFPPGLSSVRPPVRLHLGMLAATLGRHEEADAHFKRAAERGREDDPSLSAAALIAVGLTGLLSFFRHSVFHESDAKRMGLKQIAAVVLPDLIRE